MRRVVILACALLVCISFAHLIWLAENEGFDKVTPLKDDRIYQTLTNELIPRSKVTEFVIAGDSLILFYEDVGLVNIYSLDGVFQYGIQIETIDNGSGDIAFFENTLYVEARSNRMYVISQDGHIDSFLRRQNSSEYARIKTIMEQPLNHSIDNTVYYYLSGSNRIVKAEDSSPWVTVLAFPVQNDDIAPSAILLLLVCASFALYCKNKSNH